MKAAVVPFAVALLGAAGTANAQGAPQIDVRTDQTVAGVGDVVRVEATATSGDSMPTDPQIGATAGFTVRGPSRSPSETHIDVNGTRTDRYSLTADWLLRARRIGTYTVGPPSFAVGDRRYSGRSITLRVVGAGMAPARRAAPRPQPGFGFSPFDPWHSLFPDFSRAEPEPPVVTTDPKLSLQAPRDPVYFLHAAVDKASAVVGEQVTLSVYEYVDLSAAGIELDEDHDPRVADFLKHSLLKSDESPPVAGFASIGGRPWRVRLVRHWALFPLRSGSLEIGPMTVTLDSSRGGGSFRRTTETLHVRVTEAPLSGRPPGYAEGDVGRFALQAHVDPRSVAQGGVVAVRVELSGAGNFPGSVPLPAGPGVDWLAPEVHDDLGPKPDDAYGGTRTFDFVVRMNRVGDVDLGRIALPFYDPEQRRYEVARAPLGRVHVASSGSAGEASAPPPERLPGLPAPRDALENGPRVRAYPDDSALFWLLAVAGWPLALGAVVGGHAAERRIRRGWQRRRVSPAAELRERIALARTACDGPDAREGDAAIVRVLEAAAVATAGINVRGALGEEIVRRLQGAGIDHETAAGLAALLRECEAARFAPAAADPEAVRGRWGRAQRTVRLLERRG